MNISACNDKCCGCGSCFEACPQKAIEMVKDNHGFLYPQINKDLCVDCGICLKKCPVDHIETAEDVGAAYYGWNRNLEIRLKSSSGGVFSVLADYVLHSQGVIFGAVFDNDGKQVVYQCTDQVTLDDLRRSKYTESRNYGCFSEIKKQLNNGRMVLFCGTPCHVAGLKKYLPKDYNNLFLCDFVCGGAASPDFFKEHLNCLERKYSKRINRINFRDKKYGWKRMTFTVEFDNGKKKSILSYFDSYFNGFIEGIIKRQNCFSCPFADNHFSDITIADYWGYRQADVAYDKNGISMMIVHSKKGELLLNNVENQLELNKMPIENTKYTVRKRTFNQGKYEKCINFFSLADEVGYEQAAKKTYMKSPVRDLLKSYLHIK